ncbi:MAG: ImmA/IrrE family metallo-endopeptidase [Hyphomicrobium sp.]|nr:ImmA/IrrE family metallo-endopeptidase [Hyphomicrobium sp.]
MARAADFQPSWASAPGSTIAEILKHRGLTLAEFAQEVGVSTSEATAVIRGSAAIDADLADRLAILGPSAEFWMRRERHYRDSLATKAAILSAEDAQDLVKQLPIADMRRFGWIDSASLKAARLAACLRFFDVDDVSAWHYRYRSEVAVAAFRTSPTFEANPFSVAAWLRQAEIVGARIACRRWNREAFIAKLLEMRALSRLKDPQQFLPQLQSLCASCGVALVVVRAPKGCRASGATRFLSAEKALIVVSFRHRTDDHFWFTFFHEAAHLILHAEDTLFLEDGSDVTATEEAEANEYAARVLVPKEHITELSRLRLNVKAIVAFARRIGVAPGIVVGQLQHTGQARRDQLNSLKRRYSWSESSAIQLIP